MRRERWLALGGLCLYLLSLFLPAVQGSGFPTQTGWDMLDQGAGAWRDGIVAWYANPALWISLVLIWFARYRLATATAGIGLLLALSSYTAATVAEGAGRSIPPFHFAVGFYAWLGAFIIVVSATVIGAYGQRRR